jgi:hypothetical protein
VLAVRYRLAAGTTWPDLMDRLAALRYRAAVVGPHGRGKSTLLEDLAPRLEERGFRVRRITINQAHPRLDRSEREALRALGAQDVLLFDGAERLGRAGWLALRARSRGFGGLIVTSHRPGLLPTLHECETSPELLAGIVRDLLGPDAGGPCPVPVDLYTRHGGNLRDALRELYDAWAKS